MTGVEIGAAYAVDAALGDPRNWPHPVRLMGRMVERGERLIRRAAGSEHGLRAGGVVLAVALPAFASLATWGVTAAAMAVSRPLGIAVSIYLAYTTLAARDLRDHAVAVWAALDRQDLEAARRAVALMVGRDTDTLEEPEVIRAAVETVAENTADGIVAPLLCLAIGGAPLAMAYKTVNTLDSMIGHRSSRFRALGWASARLDDLVNFVPARLSGLFLVLAAFVWGGTAGEAWHIMRRDGHLHPSPNSGVPEAAMAGALGVQLGGVNYYHGLRSERPVLGDAVVALQRAHILTAMKLAWTASFLLLLVMLLGKAL